MAMFPDCRYLQLRRDGCVLHVTLNRPEVRNAINAGMWDEIEAVFDRVASDRSVRAIVLRGAGGAFCAGGDISERSAIGEGAEGQDGVARRNARAGRIFTKIDRAPQAVVAVVEKYAYGGGFGLACAADITIAAADARFRLPEVTLGLAPAQIVPFLLRRMGPAQLRRFAVTAAPISAQEAHRIGLVHHLCADRAAADAALEETLGHLRMAEPHAVQAAKSLIAAAGRMDDEAFLELAAERIGELAQSPAGLEGARAFAEKRAPDWQA